MNLKQLWGAILGIATITFSLYVMMITLWVISIHAHGGINGFISAYSFDGHFFAPPTFNVIVMTYNNPVAMIGGACIFGTLLGWISDKFSE